MSSVGADIGASAVWPVELGFWSLDACEAPILTATWCFDIPVAAIWAPARRPLSDQDTHGDALASCFRGTGRRNQDIRPRRQTPDLAATTNRMASLQARPKNGTMPRGPKAPLTVLPRCGSHVPPVVRVPSRGGQSAEPL